jgi:hypothetical protein
MRVIALVLFVCAQFTPFSDALSATSAQISTAQTNALVWLYQGQNANGTWSALPTLQIETTSAVLDTLANVGVTSGATYNAALTALQNTPPASTDAAARALDTLYRSGSNVYAQTTKLAAWSNIANGWGTLPGQGSNVADTSIATLAMLDASSTYSNQSLVNTTCNVWGPGQTTSGGWGYHPSPVGSNAPAGLATPATLPTAYALMVLPRLKSKFASVNCGSASYTLATMIANGVTWLLAKQNGDGGFGDNGTSGALETALAIRALNAVSTTTYSTQIGNAQNYLIGSQQANGAWANDAFQTALVLQTFPATTLAATQVPGVPDVVAAVLWPSTPPNPRALVPNNGQAVAGQTSSTPILTSAVFRALSQQLASPAGGVGPFTYTLVSGNLPDGVTLGSNGQLTGTPDVTGQFNFSYQVTDAQGTVTTLAGDISIADATYQVPTLPQWATLVMAVVLGVTALRRFRGANPGQSS